MTKHTGQEMFDSIRSRTLRNFVYLCRGWEEFQATQMFGPMGAEFPPSADWVMKTLHCNRRTAYDYVNAYSLLKHVDMISEALESMKKEK